MPLCALSLQETCRLIVPFHANDHFDSAIYFSLLKDSFFFISRQLYPGMNGTQSRQRDFSSLPNNPPTYLATKRVSSSVAGFLNEKFAPPRNAQERRSIPLFFH